MNNNQILESARKQEAYNGRKYYIVLDETNLQILQEAGQAKRFLSVAAAKEYGALRAGMCSVIEMIARAPMGGGMVQHLAIELH